MSEASRYDVCVIGAGPAGFAAAMRAHDLGKRVLLVERRRVGGAGVQWGALSSKTLWHLSNDYALACRRDRGFRAQGVEVRFRDVAATVAEAVAERHELMTRQLAYLAEPGPQGGRVDLRYGAARFVSPHAVEIVPEGGGAPERHEADHFVVATGSRPRAPDGIEIDGERVVTSDHIEDLGDFPESLVVVGAGVIGCEYATIFGNFGRTRAFLIDRQPRILPFEDEDVAAVITANFARMGVTVHRESTLASLRIAGAGVEYELRGPGAPAGPLRVERALVSVGRVANVEGLGLEAAGVALAPGGGIVVEGTRTTATHIYAVGDVTPDLSLVNVAELEGRHAVELMFGLGPPAIHYEALSAIMFLSPEVASVGLNEMQARKKGVAYRCGVVSNRLIGRNVAMRQTGGFIKLLAAREGGRLLGLRVVGPQAASAVQGVAFLIEQGATLEAIDRCVHPHPAITEGVQECARLMLGKSIFKPAVFGPELLRVGEGLAAAPAGRPGGALRGRGALSGAGGRHVGFGSAEPGPEHAGPEGAALEGRVDAVAGARDLPREGGRVEGAARRRLALDDAQGGKGLFVVVPRGGQGPDAGHVAEGGDEGAHGGGAALGVEGSHIVGAERDEHERGAVRGEERAQADGGGQRGNERADLRGGDVAQAERLEARAQGGGESAGQERVADVQDDGALRRGRARPFGGGGGGEKGERGGEGGGGRALSRRRARAFGARGGASTGGAPRARGHGGRA